jgi:hypothetical protein
MRARIHAALIGLTVFVAVAPTTASAASAPAPAPAPITVQALVTDAPFAGVWQASGAIDDSGTFQRTNANLTGSFFNSPTVAAFQAQFVYTGGSGTLTIRFELTFTESDFTGVWEIEAGTGAYEGASGHGTSRFTPPDSLMLTGVLRIPA